MNRLIFYLGSFVSGALIALVLVYGTAPQLMLKETRSPLGFEQTVNTIIEKVRAEGQVVPKVYDFRKSLIKHVGIDVGETTVIEICYPEQAAKLMAVPDNKVVTPFMPCAVGVYTKDDGNTYVSSLNVGMMAKLLGGDIAGPMAEVAAKDDELLSFLKD
jgi:uncharacterized protein (DUF302 family)